MAVRILLVVAVFASFYDCGLSSSAPEQDEREGEQSRVEITVPVALL